MFSNILYGADYNPEQWDPDIWKEDARWMQEAGVNRVSLGIFSWAKMEPEPGRYDFSWLKEIIDLLFAHGVSVNLATPTASPPPWLARLHPESLPVTAANVRLWHGSRRHICPHSSAYREYARRLVTRLAQEFGNHPGLALWHIDNEYTNGVAECFCDQSQAAFRRWLEDIYHSIDALNDAWGTTFWSQHYLSWDEIRAPAPTPVQANPAQKLDWQRFCSDSWLECFQEQIDVLREITPHIPVTTNFMRFHPSLDHWKWAGREDLVSLDDYPDQTDPVWMEKSAMIFDLVRSLKPGRPWLLMEQATTHVNWRMRNPTKKPGIMRAGSFQALARGANGVMFFQWRASKAGAEKFHSAMVPHSGTDTRVWRDVKSLGAELKRLDSLLPSRLYSEVAILFDWENWWALEAGDKPANDFLLLPRVTQIYSELYRRNISVDFAHPESDLSAYRLVIAPHLYLVSDRAAGNIEQYVAGGGALWMNFFSGIVDNNEHVRLGGYPAPFRKLLGMWVEEFSAYGVTDVFHVETEEGKQFVCDFWSDLIHLEGAESLAQYSDNYIAGYPAITRHSFANGTSYYLGTSLEPAGLSWLVERICRETGVQKYTGIPAGVEITRRRDGSRTWLFLLNHSAEMVRVPLARLTSQKMAYDWIAETELEGEIALEPAGVAILQLNEA